MGLDMKRRRLARSLHAELTAKEYGKYLFLKHKDTIERLYLQNDMLVPEKELERICGEMLHDIFNSIGHAIRMNVEVKITPINKSEKTYFTIAYKKRNERSTIEYYLRNRSKATTPRIDS